MQPAAFPIVLELRSISRWGDLYGHRRGRGPFSKGNPVRLARLRSRTHGPNTREPVRTVTRPQTYARSESRRIPLMGATHQCGGPNSRFHGWRQFPSDREWPARRAGAKRGGHPTGNAAPADRTKGNGASPRRRQSKDAARAAEYESLAEAYELCNRTTEQLNNGASGPFWRKVEVDQSSLESLCLPRAECDSDRHPDPTGDLRGAAEIDPQHEANQKTEQWQDEVGQLLFLGPNVIVHDYR